MNDEAPRFELRRIDADGRQRGEPEIYPLLQLPEEARMGRRGFLGAGLAIGGALGAILAAGGCGTAPPRKRPRRAASTAAEPTEATTATTESTATAPASPVTSCGPGLLAHRGQVTALAVSPDGKWLATAASDAEVKLWRLPEATLYKRFKAGSKPLRSVVFSADSRFLISAASDSRARSYELSSGKRGEIYWKAGSGNLSLAVNQGNLLAIASRTRPEISLWQLPAGSGKGLIDGLDMGASCVAFSRDGRLLAGGLAKTIAVWDVAQRQRITTLAGLKHRPTAIAFSADGNWLAAGDELGYSAIWSLPDGRLQRSIKGNLSEVRAIVFAPAGEVLVTTGASEITLWGMPDLKHLKTIDKHRRKGVSSLVFTTDGRYLVSGGGDNSVRFWSTPQGRLENCLFDPAAVTKSQKSMQFTHSDSYGQTITYTLPCGSPIPPGAVCTCNCVPGSYVPSRPKSSRSRSRSRSGGGSYCSCNKVCTCVPVYYCQAHRLLDRDPLVRGLAEQLLLLLGRENFSYMRWAASEVRGTLRQAIGSMMRSIAAGRVAEPQRWPGDAILAGYLDHRDQVTSLMAAQLIVLRRRRGGNARSGRLLARAQAVLRSGQARHLAVRAKVERFAAGR